MTYKSADPTGHPIFGDLHGAATWLIHDLEDYAVPCFMLTSFFFSYGHFAALNGKWLKDRFTRLLVPFAVWTAVTFAVFSMLPAFADFAKPTWKDFAYSALGTNVAIGAHMWFMADIIILTGVFALFCRFVPERFRETGLWMILLIAVMIEYTGVNYELFKTWHHDSQRPIGRIIPMVPYACLGLIAGCSRRRWSELPTAYRALLCIGGIAVALFLINFDVFVKPRGYSYTGLKMFAMAVALSSAAFFAPFDILQPCVGSIIVAISCYTMGIYFIHILVGRPLQNFVFAHTGLVQQSFLGSIAIFAVCWTVCWIVSLIPSKWARSLVE